MKCIAIIPARGGSKRIPGKNIRSFLGRPIIEYGVEAAVQSGLFDTVMVSTDSDAIADVAQNVGASFPFYRSEKNAGDFATTLDVIKEVLDAYKEKGKTFEYVCCIYPTAPFITSEKLKTAFDLLIKNNYDSVFPVLRFSFPIQRALRINKEERVEMCQPENISARSQDLEPTYHDSGQFYFFRAKPILEQKRLWTDNTGAIVVPEMEAHDIDTEEDWEIAEFKYQILKK